MSGATGTAEAGVGAVLEAMSAALRAKDFDDLGACYAEDVCVYDIGAQMVGYAALRELWLQCLPYFPHPIGVERRDVRGWYGEDVAAISFLSRVSGMEETDDPTAKSWFRGTMVLRRFGDAWKIVHDHNSFGFDCMTGKPVLIEDGA